MEVEGLQAKLLLAAVAYYDGSDTLFAVDLVFPGQRRPPDTLLELEMRVLSDVEYEGMRLAAFDPRVEAAELQRAGLRMLSRIVESRVVNVSRELETRLGIRVEDPAWLAEHIRVEDQAWAEQPSPEDLQKVLEALGQKLRGARPPAWLEDRLRRLLTGFARAVYLALLAAEATQQG
ncbi:hypothetical protein [Pyrodictium abyssi]|uniref:Uncharacterized protein n=1 Tax=Pyrodictium abyssi TaxID=54256 RepID=A0ABM8IW06_9CREN|nr:hypothetical protein PABY_13110 [Pyrodictium abyssi]